MILSTDVRREKLKEIRANSAKEGDQKLFYKGKNEHFGVYRIDLDYLIFNRHNGRIEAEMLTWEKEHVAPVDAYDEELHAKIEAFLWESSKSRNQHTLKDLDAKGQQRPGIISLDGVIIDGNRRAMLLKRLEKSKGKQYFDAIILPDSYAGNEKDIVRLETQYQLGEDSKVEYGPLQKYLHAKRLARSLGIEAEEIDILMGQQSGRADELLEIMDLMDEYLEYIGCPGLYLMLKDSGGTKEGMFVDLYRDLKRYASDKAHVRWAFDELDVERLKQIHFDYMRLGETADAGKSYREISRQSKGKNFFSNKEIWDIFSQKHADNVDPATMEMGSLEDFISKDPDAYGSKLDAARSRDEVWKAQVRDPMVGNFGQASYKLDLFIETLGPSEYLKRAKDQLEKVDPSNEAFRSHRENKQILIDIGRIAFDLKKLLE